ncbi:MAG: endolytic transglycosylase MltG [Acidobacteriota bacterium]
MRKVALLIFMVIVAAGTAAATVYFRTQQSYRGYEGDEQFVDIPPGSSTKTIGDRLVEAGVVRDPLTYRLALLLSGQARGLKAGEYRFEQAMTPLQVLEKIARGEVYSIAVTFPEGLTIAEMAAIAESHRLGSASAFIAAASDKALVRTLDPLAQDLEGYLFPETYRVSRHTDGPALVRLMVNRFDHVFSPELRRGAEKHGLSVHQLVVLASLVEKETARADERPIVAAVYLNRFRIGMALQCDPTIIFALQRAGTYTGNLRREDLALDSPYNTYRYPGLPPGPIAAPGKASLEAVVNSADVDYLYFVSRNDGSHEFAATLAAHNRNVQKYQVQYFRDRKAARSSH